MEAYKAPLQGEYDIPPELDVYSDVQGGQLPADMVTPTSAGILGRVLRGLGLAGTGYVGGSMLMGPWSGSGQPPAQPQAQPQQQPQPARPAQGAPQGRPAQAQPAPAQPPAEGGRRQSGPARAALEAAENRVMEEQRERRGLSPFDIAMIQLGLGMMGSTRSSPLAAMSDAAGPALQTYVALDRNRENADIRRESERNRILRDRAMLERYDEDRASRDAIAQRNHDRMMAQFAMRGRGGSGGEASGLTREQIAELRPLLSRRAVLLGGGGTGMTEEQRARALRDIQAQIASIRGSGAARDPSNPLGLPVRPAPTE